MDDIPKRADDEAWDKKANRRISDINQSIEKGLSGEALAALHGLHIAPNDNLPYDVDESSEMDNQEMLRDKIISRTVQIGDSISREQSRWWDFNPGKIFGDRFRSSLRLH